MIARLCVHFLYGNKLETSTIAIDTRKLINLTLNRAHAEVTGKISWKKRIRSMDVYSY